MSQMKVPDGSSRVSPTLLIVRLVDKPMAVNRRRLTTVDGIPTNGNLRPAVRVKGSVPVFPDWQLNEAACAKPSEIVAVPSTSHWTLGVAVGMHLVWRICKMVAGAVAGMMIKAIGKLMSGTYLALAIASSELNGRRLIVIVPVSTGP